MFMYSYCYVCSVLCILFHCVVLRTVCVSMCTVLLPPGVNPTTVDKYIKFKPMFSAILSIFDAINRSKFTFSLHFRNLKLNTVPNVAKTQT